MKFRLFTIAAMACMLITSGVLAADSTGNTWTKSLIIDVTATQTSYSDSWAGGEAGSFNWVSNLNGSAEKNLTPIFNYKSTLKMSFGQTLSQDAETKRWSKPIKSTDLIDWENVGRFTLHKLVDPYIAFRLESQFADASFAQKRLALSPTKLTESAGMARVFIDNERKNLTSRLGLGLRQIMTKFIVDTMALTTDSKTTTDGGFESVTDLKVNFNERMSYVGKLSLYKAMFYSEKDGVAGTPGEDDWKAVDVNWENTISATVTKLVSVNLYAQLLYDKQISYKGRLKETLGIGLVYRMI